MLTEIVDDFQSNSALGLRGLLLLAIYRVGHRLHGRHLRASYPLRIPLRAATLSLKIPYGVLCHSYGCFIPFPATLGQRIRFRHSYYGIFISADAHVGDDAIIFHHVTIGSNYDTAASGGAPRIGEGVLIGAGAKLIGPITIGDRVRIGANAAISDDVPPDTTVVALKPRLVSRSTRNT